MMGDPFRAGHLMSIHGFIQRDGTEKQVPLTSRRMKEDYVQVLRLDYFYNSAMIFFLNMKHFKNRISHTLITFTF